MIEISPLQKHEIDEAVDLLALCFGENFRPYALTDVSYTFEKASYVPRTFVARTDGKIVGSIQSVNGYIASSLRAFAWVATHPNHRRNGIAEKLLQYAE
jgi:ribosomal protein S18 acetylase RimI-like enzyme